MIKSGIPLFNSVSEGRMNLLIVDDSDFIRERLVAIFEDSEKIGVVYQARNSYEAIEQLNAFSPEMVLLDIRIPGDNGIKVLEKFKKLRPETWIIMLTNYPYEQYRKRCLELGADYFFEKSEDMNEIFNLCENLSVNHISS